MNQYPIMMMVLMLASAALIPIVNVKFKQHLHAFIMIVMSALVLLGIFNVKHVIAFGESYINFGGYRASIGIEFYISQLSSLFVLFVIVLSWIIILYSLKDMDHHIANSKLKSYYTLVFLMLFALIGLSFTFDMFNMYVFMEILSLTSAAIISIKDKRENILASFRYLLLNTIGSLSILFGIALLYMVSGHLNMGELYRSMSTLIELYPMNLLLAIGFMFMGLAIKSAMFPMHVWLPDAHSTAPSPSSALLSGIVVKVYIFTVIKLMVYVFGVDVIRTLQIDVAISILAVVGMIMGSIFAIGQKDIKRMLAYSSVAQIGYMFLGLSLLTSAGIAAVMFHIITHGIIKSALFLSAGSIIYKTDIRDLRQFNGMGYTMPLTMAVFSVAALGLIGIPGINGFMSKVYLSLAIVDGGQPLLLGAILVSSYLNAVYYLPIIINSFLRNDPVSQPNMIAEKLPNVMIASMLVLLLAMIVTGFYPQLFMRSIESAVAFLGL